MDRFKVLAKAALNLAVVIGLTWTIASALVGMARTPREIAKARDAYLCVELRKLGERAPACDRVMGAK